MKEINLNGLLYYCSLISYHYLRLSCLQHCGINLLSCDHAEILLQIVMLFSLNLGWHFSYEKRPMLKLLMTKSTKSLLQPIAR